METAKKKVRLYVSRDGKCPYRTWFESLNDVDAQARILKRLARVEMGNLGACNFVGEGVYELKIDYGHGYRIYFGQEEGETIILLGGGIKKSQAADILRARKYWADWRRR